MGTLARTDVGILTEVDLGQFVAFSVQFFVTTFKGC